MPKKKSSRHLQQLAQARQKELDRRSGPADEMDQPQHPSPEMSPDPTLHTSTSEDHSLSVPASSATPSPPPFPITSPSLPSDFTSPTSSPPPFPSTSASTPPAVPSTSSALPPSPIPSTSADSISLIIPLSTPLPPPPQEPAPRLSRSEKKIALYKTHFSQDVEDSGCVRTVVEIKQLEKIFRDLRCPECTSVRGLDLDIPKQFGMSLKLSVVCRDCGETVSSHYTSARNERSTSTPQPFVVNEACVFASLLAGMGSSSFRNFCEYLEMPGMHPKTFNSVASRIYSKNELIGDKIFSQAAAIVRKKHAEQFYISLQEEDVLDISVSFDGSWLTRGHKSLVGLGSVIDVLTGIVLDVHVLNMHCQTCATTGAFIKRETPHRFEAWKARHIASGECRINFEGTSGMMEVKAAEILWGRSIERHRLRYTTMVSDGDSKSFNKLTEIKPYGQDFLVEKEDCLNHVGKRMGTALRNLVADSSKRGVTLGGRGHGRLTQDTMRKLQIYYSRAIRNNKTAAEMRKAILASLYHGYSTDDLPQHQYCPPGLDSWCFYKRSIGEHRYPSGHKNRIHTPLDYELLHKYLEPLYRRLTSDDLLKRCELKTTQNPNESFHHSVWSRCSKKNLHSLQRVQFAAIAAAAEFNRGPEAIASIKQVLDIDAGKYGTKFGKVRERKRLLQSTLDAQQAAKKRKKVRAAAQEKARQEKEAEEGGPAYQAGMF